MEALEETALIVFLGSLAGLVLVFAVYPCSVSLAAALRRRIRPGALDRPPGVSLLVPVRNGERLIEEKVRNALALDPGLEIVFVSDGSTDATENLIRSLAGDRAKLIASSEHLGKAQALNRGLAACTGDIVVFSDADALLAPDALDHMLPHFADPTVGGVCGRRVIRERPGELAQAQSRYITLDSALKQAESRLGSITSNDGKLYSIRRELFRPIAPGATDDLFVALNVVQQGFRFVFEPRARAFIPTPSRNAAHELARRRRIVSRSLHGIFLMKEVLNPLRHGGFSLQLLINKVFRRLLPVFLILLFVSSAVLAPSRPWIGFLFLLQVVFYALALCHLLSATPDAARTIRRATSVACYFCVGNAGTLLGLLDFLKRKETVKWDPLKAD
jgi:cellulose synthase/poly-beta-1,6-N-acetylglucosamine synthase-like glycosyltransferase